MSLRKQAEGWGLAFLLVALFAGMFYLAMYLLTGILGVLFVNNTEQQNKAIAQLILGGSIIIFLLLNLE